ncbi:MAG: hypothetical protein A2X13_14540 [Bacteroidetes bacterium GWC2_33_15]|nr:MAG: hypothetical protein A2X10_12585 [Bacteroidetes bacterium GWA2_33_15]OFX50090.1 MAG: hypothetical protein A2X13_14540 [Bacteroidetes bacterium GWC2_33_15]OFX65243.1 MAG: hypothetical protein A2X15_04115 [Bacteroidetes bacterium GWB2_32_14]OFX70469.1 MAG: hypothetical protein A2X14_04170 [Bacteroidetes bacterium GWD2_33_33]HAN19658.1 hypothetical protein [Bacteroidales bacterium]
MLTKHHLSKIKEKLPNKYVTELMKRLNNPEISKGLVYAVMNGNKEDYYGIVNAAIMWGIEIEHEKRKMLKKAGLNE